MSSRKWTRRTHKAGLFAVLAWGLGSCAPQVSTIWIDLSQFPAPPSKPLSVVLPPGEGIPAAQAELPALPRQSILGGDVNAMTQGAREKALEAQNSLFEELKSRLTEVYTAEAVRANTEKEEALWTEHQARLEEAFTLIRTRFDAHAEDVGPLVQRLAWLSGFPDPDPKSRRPLRGSYAQQEQSRKAKEVRPQIAEKREALSREIEEILTGVAADYRADLEALAEDLEQARGQAAQRAESEARQEAARSMVGLEDSAFRSDKSLPDAPAVRVSRPPLPGPASRILRAPEREVWAHADQIRSQALVFARARGWQLSDNPKGAADKTAEFKEWRRQMGLDPSTKSPSSSGQN